jgi:predicted ATPase/class 3 adenylate cyclase
MAALPTGTVTFLFTDLEGSTRLFERYPVEMQDVMAQHDESVRDVVERYGGQVVKFTGDGVLAVFGGARDAVDAAVELQVEVGRRDWAAGIVPLLRVGLHTGEAVQRADDYFGPEVNRAARVMSVAHGGQIVCSSATAELVREKVELIDLDVHQLRDVQSEMHMWQVAAAGLRREFPPLRSLDVSVSNLPLELSSFVGRGQEVGEVAALLVGCRVVTVIGVGGVGKTRLALQAACEVLSMYPDGVWFCELAAARASEDVLEAVASAVRYVPPQGTSVAEGLVRFLEHKTVLIVLDNCEHLVRSVADFVKDTVTVAPGVTVLATSREGLRTPGERLYPLGSLQRPDGDDPEAVLASESGRLFALRSQEARGDFVVNDENAAAIGALCVRLDGIPLAIELAAARTVAMSPGEIVERLDRQFRLLTSGARTAQERHQTLRAAIDWSYDLLADNERRLLQHCALFVGGFNSTAAVALGAGIGMDELDVLDALQSLVMKSLVERSERGSRTRYGLLEMIRQYALEELERCGQDAAARDLHADHYTRLAVEQFECALTPAAWDALSDLERDVANLGAAGRWLLDSGRVAELLQLYADLRFIEPTSLPAALVDVLGRLAADAADDRSSSQPGWEEACFMAAMRHFIDGDSADFRRYSELGADLGHGTSAQLLLLQDTVAFFDGAVDDAIALAGRAVEIARRSARPEELAFALASLSVFEDYRTPDVAKTHASEAVSLARTLGSPIPLVYVLTALARALRETDPATALLAAQECIMIDQSQRRTWSSYSRSLAARIHFEGGDVVAGLRELRESLRLSTLDGDRYLISGLVSMLSLTIAELAPELALQIAAITASGVIATIESVKLHPALRLIAEQHPDQLQQSQTIATTMSYTDAITFIIDGIDQLINQLTNAD